MDTHKKIREHISALSDGELSVSDVELAFAALQGADGQHAWNTYHRIGDVLRAQATPELSDSFAERLAVRLAGEPAPQKRARTTGNVNASLNANAEAGAGKRAGASDGAAHGGAVGARSQAGETANTVSSAPADAMAVVKAKPAVTAVS